MLLVVPFITWMEAGASASRVTPTDCAVSEETARTATTADGWIMCDFARHSQVGGLGNTLPSSPSLFDSECWITKNTYWVTSPRFVHPSTVKKSATEMASASDCRNACQVVGRSEFGGMALFVRVAAIVVFATRCPTVFSSLWMRRQSLSEFCRSRKRELSTIWPNHRHACGRGNSSCRSAIQFSDSARPTRRHSPGTALLSLRDNCAIALRSLRC